MGVCSKVLSIMLLVFVVFLVPTNMMAKSWTDGADQSIYSSSAGVDMEKTEESTEVKEPSKVEQWFSGVVIGLADGLNDMFSKLDMSLDQVVCGRVGSEGSKIALFSFELVEGNPYGTIAAVIYNSIRSIIFVVMAVLLATFFSKFSVVSGNSSERARFKDTLTNYLWSYGVLFLMPYLLDLWLYIRDQILYVVLIVQGDFLNKLTNNPGESLALVGYFKSLAESSASIVDALMYLGAVIITLFFAFEYAGMSMAMLIMMILFPIMCVKANIERGALSGWVWDVFSISFTPIMDMILLSVPLYMGALFPEQWLLKILTCVLVIPTRMVAKRLLGMTSAGGGLLNGMMAFAALRSGANMAKRGASRVASIADAVKNSHSDKEKSKYHNEMAAAENEDKKDVMKANGFDALSSAPEGKSSFGIGKEGKKSRLAAMAESFGFHGKEGEAKAEVSDGEMDGTSESMSGMSSLSRIETSGAEDGETFDGVARNLAKEKGALKSENSQSRQRIADLNRKKSDLQKRNADLKQQEAESGGWESYEWEIAKNNTKIAGYNQQIADEQKKIAANDTRMSAIDANLNSMSGVSGGKASSISDRQMAVLQRMANVNNFESPEFSNLSHADKAALYQKRARRNMVRAAARSVPIVTGTLAGASLAAAGGAGAVVAGGLAGGALGSSGSFTGSMLGLGAGMFMGPAAMVNAVNIGSMAGGAVNTAVSGVAGSAINAAVGSKLSNPSVQTRYISNVNAAAYASDPQQVQLAVQRANVTGGVPQTVQVDMNEVLMEPVSVAGMSESMNVMDISAEMNRKINENIRAAMDSINHAAHDDIQVNIQGAMRNVAGGRNFNALSPSQKREAVLNAGVSVVVDNIEEVLEKLDLANHSYDGVGKEIIMEKIKKDANVVAMADRFIREYEELEEKSRLDVNE